MATAAELAKLIGRTAEYEVCGLSFRVGIMDAKMAYGDVRLLIEPVDGSGQRWVSKGSLIL